MPKFGKHSKKRLETIHPDLQRLLKEAIKYFDFTVIEGTRTIQRQKYLKKTGKTKTIKSKHLDGLAVDIAPYPIDWVNIERFIYLAGWVKGIASQMNIDIRWGGDWDNDTRLKNNIFDDYVHFELMGDI